MILIIVPVLSLARDPLVQERRLQTQVFKLGLAKSIHHARVLIRQRHIRFELKKMLCCSLATVAFF